MKQAGNCLVALLMLFKSSVGSSSGVGLTILSYNARNCDDGAGWDQRKAMLTTQIISSGADVVVLQEMRNSSSCGNMHLDIAQSIEILYPHNFWTPAMIYSDISSTEGQSFFSKVPWSEAPETLHFNNTGVDLNLRIATRLPVAPKVWSTTAGIVTWSSSPVTYPGCFIAIYATHLSTDRSEQLGNAGEMTMWMAESAAQNGVGQPIIGDLNSKYESDDGLNNELIDFFGNEAQNGFAEFYDVPDVNCTFECSDPVLASHRDRMLVPIAEHPQGYSTCKTVGNHSISDHLGLLCVYAVEIADGLCANPPPTQAPILGVDVHAIENSSSTPPTSTASDSVVFVDENSTMSPTSTPVENSTAGPSEITSFTLMPDDNNTGAPTSLPTIAPSDFDDNATEAPITPASSAPSIADNNNTESPAIESTSSPSDFETNNTEGPVTMTSSAPSMDYSLTSTVPTPSPSQSTTVSHTKFAATSTTNLPLVWFPNQADDDSSSGTAAAVIIMLIIAGVAVFIYVKYYRGQGKSSSSFYGLVDNNKYEHFLGSTNGESPM